MSAVRQGAMVDQGGVSAEDEVERETRPRKRSHRVYGPEWANVVSA